MKAAFVFPGQGSQSVAMMDAYGDLPDIRATFDEASECLGKDLWRLVSQGPSEDLGLTVNTQPVMLAAGVAVYRAWLGSGGTKPDFVAGHSLAEYSALVASEAMRFADAVRLVGIRAQAMQDAVPAGLGAIAAVLGLDDAEVLAACEAARQGEVVEPANFNTPGQLVISGHRSAVERAIELAKQKGAKRAVMLPMSIPAHCSLMRPAAEQLKPYLAQVELRAPAIPVIHNFDVQSHADPGEIRSVLEKQIYSPVRWSDTVASLARMGVTHVIECGPGKVLVGLTKRIDPNLKSLALADAPSMQQAKVALTEAG